MGFEPVRASLISHEMFSSSIDSRTDLWNIDQINSRLTLPTDGYYIARPVSLIRAKSKMELGEARSDL